MIDTVALLSNAMERHITWDEHADEAMGSLGFTIDADIDTSPYKVAPFWQSPPDSSAVYEWDEIVGMFANVNDEPPAQTIAAGKYQIWLRGQEATPTPPGKTAPPQAYISNKGEPEPQNVLSQIYTTRTELSQIYATRTENEASYETFVRNYLTILDADGNQHEASLFDLLTLMAANDARKAGRDADADALIEAMPHMEGLHLLSLTREQAEAIMSHIGDRKPIVMRLGGKRITQAMGASSRHRMWSDGTTYFTTAGKDNSLTIFSIDGKGLLVGAGTNKMLAHLGSIIVRDGLSCGADELLRVETSYGEIFEARDMKDTRGNRRRIRTELDALSNTAFRWEDSNGNTHDVPIRGGDVSIRRDGTISFAFSPDFMKMVIGHNAGLVAADALLMSTDDQQHPHAFAIGLKLTINAYQNADKPNRYRTSVRSLLGHVKSIPSYEDVADTDRAYTRRIIAPMERDLDYLVELGVLRYWEYCHTNSEPLTDEEQASRLNESGEETALPYEHAIGCLIEWEPTHPYDGHTQATLDARERSRQRNAKRTGKTAKSVSRHR